MPVTATLYNGTATPRTSTVTVPAYGTLAVTALADLDVVALLQFDGIGIVKHSTDEVRRLASKVARLGKNPGTATA